MGQERSERINDMNREDELQGIIDFQTKEIKELKAENEELKEYEWKYKVLCK